MDRAASESEIILQKVKEQLLNGDYQKNNSNFQQPTAIFIPYYGVHPKLRLVMGRSWMRLPGHDPLLAASQQERKAEHCTYSTTSHQAVI